jgi:hypothetical protein
MEKMLIDAETQLNQLHSSIDHLTEQQTAEREKQLNELIGGLTDR